MYAWEFIRKGGAWISATEDFKELLLENDLEFPEKVQGENNLFKTIEENEDLANFLVKYFKNAIGELS